MTRSDLIVVIAVAIIAAAAWPIAVLARAGSLGDVAVVTGPGGSSELRLDAPRRVVIEGTNGEVTLEVEGSAVRVVDSTCTDRLCIGQGRISARGAALVCVPNGVTVRVGGDRDAPDAVVR